MNHLSTETLIDYLHGELTAQGDADAYAHLSLCAACSEARDQEAALTDALRAGAAAQEREFPSLVAAAVWERVRSAPPSPLAWLSGLLRPAIAVPAAALVVVGAWFASPLGHGAGTPRSIDALYYFQAHAAQSASSPLSEHSGMPAAETSLSDDTVAAPAMIDQYAAYAVPGRIDDMR